MRRFARSTKTSTWGPGAVFNGAIDLNGFNLVIEGFIGLESGELMTTALILHQRLLYGGQPPGCATDMRPARHCAARKTRRAGIHAAICGEIHGGSSGGKIPGAGGADRALSKKTWGAWDRPPLRRYGARRRSRLLTGE